MELRPYQMEAIELIRDAYRKGFKAPILVAPCGSGKSWQASYMAKRVTDKGNRVLTMAHRIEICSQLTDTFTNFGVNMDLCDVGMVQKFTRRVDRMQKPSLIICDEHHHSSSSTYKRIYDAFPDVPRIGFTATPCRLSGRPLSDVSDVIIQSKSARWLIDNNYLAPYQYYAPQLADFSKIKKRAGEYDTEEQAAMLSKPKIFGDVIEHYNRLASGKKAICYCPSVQYSKDMCERFNEAGISAAHLDGTTPSDDRKGIMDAFRSGSVMILCNNEIVSEGVSVDDCEVCILLRKTASLTLFVQQSMRCMRYQPGKIAIIIDHVANYLQHGMPDAEREWSLTSTLKPPSAHNPDGTLRIRQCKKCYFTFETAPVCPNCGEPYAKTREEIKCIAEVELKRIEESKQARKDAFKSTAEEIVKEYTSESQCRNMTELQAFARKTGRKPGWAWHVGKVRGFVK